MKYAPLIIKKLADLLVGNNTANKLSGKDLVDLFNNFGFNDDYIYPSVDCYGRLRKWFVKNGLCT